MIKSSVFISVMDEIFYMEEKEEEKEEVIEVHDFMDRIFNYFFVKYPKSRKVLPLYLRMKELMMYGLFGLGTFVIAMVSYAIFTEAMDMNVLIGNALCWVLATMFSFLTNRRWVFPIHERGFKAFSKQLWQFTGGRLVTLLIEEFMLGILVQALGLPNMWIKLFAQIIVVSLNYLFSKVWVFNKKKVQNVEGISNIQAEQKCIEKESEAG